MQNDVEAELKALFVNEQYQEMMDAYSPQAEEYTPQELYYLVAACLMLDDTENAVKYLDISLEKDSSNAESFYVRGTLLNAEGKYEEAIADFQKAMDLHPENGELYTALGESWFYLEQYEQALDAYTKATQQKKTTDRPFYMIALIYEALNDKPAMLEALYTAKENIKEEIDYYTYVLFNIGALEIELNADYEKAEAAYLELLQASSSDYPVYANLIRIYYHRKEYEKAAPYREKLYKAWEEGLLRYTEVENMFCFDTFLWNKKQVMAFEKYGNENNREAYSAYLFYVMDEEGGRDYTIEVEFNPPSASSDTPEYRLFAVVGESRQNPGIRLDKAVAYDDLKKAVVDALEKITR